MPKKNDPTDLTSTLSRLKEISRWFDEQEEVDIEAGLLKVKEGAELVRKGKERLSELENEFIEIRKQLNDENP